MHFRLLFDRRHVPLVLALTLFVSVVSCALPTEPKAIAETFLKALQSRDYRLARDLVDTNSVNKVIAVQNIASVLSPEDQAIITGIGPGAIEIKSLEEGPELAIVDWTLGGIRGEPLNLVKEAGLWRVRWQARSIYP